MKERTLGGLAKRMSELATVSEELPAALRDIRYDEEDPQSIKSALEKIKQRVDEEASKYPDNTHVQNFTQKIKHTQSVILSEKADVARKK